MDRGIDYEYKRLKDSTNIRQYGDISWDPEKLSDGKKPEDINRVTLSL
jgi:hypothetical protein